MTNANEELMNTYISILRGINVSGQKLIKMTELKSHFENLGYSNVVTYIQSGNVIFKSSNSSTNALAVEISKMIKQVYGFDVPVLVLTKDELIEVANNNPYLNMEEILNESLYITFLTEEPATAKINQIDTTSFLPDEFTILGKNLYLHVVNGYGKTKLSNNFFENKLKVTATTRNIKTVNKLIELAQ